MSLILSEKAGAIGVVRINRPELNLLSQPMLEELSNAFKELKNQSDLRAVILTGTGEVAFCAGIDPPERSSLKHLDAGVGASRVHSVCEEIENFPVPVIAAINGLAAHAGFELALACPLRFASTNAQFSSHDELALGPDAGVNHRLAQEIGQCPELGAMNTGKV